MIVITLEKCPLALRGDLTKWLQEISPGVYVGQVSARVRDRLWDRVCSESKSGRATMVFTARNEQHYDFRVHNALWEPVEYDGVKLMMRPSPARIEARKKGRTGFSKLSHCDHHHKKGVWQSDWLPAAFAVVDVETTGLSPQEDSIIELAALKVVAGEVTDSCECLVRTDEGLPVDIVRLTGIDDGTLARDGVPLCDALDMFFDIVGELPIAGHNVTFDAVFLQEACDECGFGNLDNVNIDSVEIARKKLPRLRSYRLADLAASLGIEVNQRHRAMADCRTDLAILLKLNEIR